MAPRWPGAGALLLLWVASLSTVDCHYDGLYEHPKNFWQPQAIRRPSGMLASLRAAAITISLNATAFTANRQPVAVAVSGVADPDPSDFVSLYVPGDVDVTSTVPIAFFNLTRATGGKYLVHGNATMVFTLLNMRQSFGFKLVRHGPGQDSPLLLAESQVLPNTIPRQPTSGHLALHEDGQSVVVQWVSGGSAPQRVRWRLADEPYSEARTVTSTVSTYGRDDMCGFPANSTGWLDPGILHMAVLPSAPPNGLVPSTRYAFTYGSEADGWSAEHEFTAPPVAGPSPEPFKFLVFNDVCMGADVLFYNPPGSPFHVNGTSGLAFQPYGVNSTKTSSRLASHERDAQLALLIGDLSYALGYAADWDVFGQQFEDAFTQWPLMTGTGNHERDWPGTGDAFNDVAHDSGGECNVPHSQRYYSPAFARPGATPLEGWYAFRMGPVHFVILDSEAPTHPGSAMHSWLKEELTQRVDRTVTPWLVVGLHRMMYAPATWSAPWVGDLQVMERIQLDLEELFKQHGVDVVLQGHEHAYARTCKVYKQRCVSDAPVYILAGHAGAGFTHGFPQPAAMPEWVTAAVQDRTGYLRFIASPTALVMEAVSSDDGHTVDYLRLKKPLEQQQQQQQQLSLVGAPGTAAARQEA